MNEEKYKFRRVLNLKAWLRLRVDNQASERWQARPVLAGGGGKNLSMNGW